MNAENADGRAPAALGELPTAHGRHGEVGDHQPEPFVEAGLVDQPDRLGKPFRSRRMYFAGMDPAFLAPLIPIAAIVAFAAVKIAKLRATSGHSLPADAAERLEALEHKVDGLQQELAETHERLDFAERMLSQARDTRRLGE